MSHLIPESTLPTDISLSAAVEAAYPDELTRATEALLRGLTTIVECDKGMVGFFYATLRNRLKKEKIRCIYVDGRIPPQPGGMPMGLSATMLEQIRDAVRGGTHGEGEERRVIVLPHLDLLATSSGGLTTEARETIALLYENPQILWLAFRDPSFSLPKSISNLFHHRINISGLPRDRVQYLVTQRESRLLGRGGLDIYKLYKHVSGLHVVAFRQLMSSLRGEDYPDHADPIWAQIRQATVEGTMSIPEMSLEKDIGGYADVKTKIVEDILDIIKRKEELTDPAAIARIEGLIPRGMIFWGPPGTGKTLFAKAMAAELGAAVQVVNGPELKSRWVGESEENLRRIFTQARQSAPSLIVFDELDSFAPQRGTYTGSGVEHSMVNQLLTEMDGFRNNEMVFVIGTTNFVESIDSALLRPGRFEFHLHIPYPKAEDREAILNIYDQKFGLQFTSEALSFAVRQTGQPIEGSSSSGQWSGDHIQALCRAIARQRLRKGNEGPTIIADIEKALTSNQDLPKFTQEEELVIATHECGHAIVAIHTPHSPPIDRISIRGDVAGALGFVRFADPAHKYVVTHNQLLDSIATLFGGRQAELMMLDQLSIGSAHDLERATKIARALVVEFGYQPDQQGAVRTYEKDELLSDAVRVTIEKDINTVLDRQRERASAILQANRGELEVLRDQLLKDKVIEVKRT